MTPREAPRPAPRVKVTSSFRYDDGKVPATMASLRGKPRLVTEPFHLRHPTDDWHQQQQRPVAPPRADGAGRNEMPTVNLSAINNTGHFAYSREQPTGQRKVGDVKKRPVPPCPCPDDIKPHFKATRRGQVPISDIEDLNVKDQKGYCRMMNAKLNEVLFRSTGPMQHNLRGRLLAEQTWFELQSKMFLPTPITNQRSFLEVLHRFEIKRNSLARKERNIWKQVGRHCISGTF